MFIVHTRCSLLINVTSSFSTCIQMPEEQDSFLAKKISKQRFDRCVIVSHKLLFYFISSAIHNFLVLSRFMRVFIAVSKKYPIKRDFFLSACFFLFLSSAQAATASRRMHSFQKENRFFFTSAVMVFPP